MLIQKQKVGKYKDKQYFQYGLNLPADIIETLGWKAGQKVKLLVHNGKLVIEKE